MKVVPRGERSSWHIVKPIFGLIGKGKRKGSKSDLVWRDSFRHHCTTSDHKFRYVPKRILSRKTMKLRK
ncbi:unnamed protein product [Cuscuta campestris]|uniref:Uncharacterized protein n=1 Tax=Cuscuta campestris TaxID=132261 RepID=A0A484M6W3_9ASTE|nr:unnamed protein product [Cuscuta campestris]